MEWKRDDQKWISCDQTRGETDQKSDDEMRKGLEGKDKDQQWS